MTQGRLDPAGRRELARLVAEDGLSPREAAGRLGVTEGTARRMVARWYAAYEAEQLFDGEGEREWTPPVPVGVPRRAPAATRRRVAGVALVLAFVPVGAFASAALFGGDDADPSGPRGVKAGATDFQASAARAPRGKNTTLAAHVNGSSVRAYARPDGRARSRVVRARRNEGRNLPLVLLVDKRRTRWLKVSLPTRPNLSTGWIRRRGVRLRVNEWRLRVELSKHRILLWRGDRFISSHRIGVGKSVTPTPKGRYYFTDLVKPPNPDGLYGSYAFGLSAHSKVVTSFGTGDGQIGVHGTNNPKGLGRNVSSGCIRVADSVIQSYARHLPLGTPVVIRR